MSLIAGKTVVFTGTLSITRNEARALAVNAGANISDTVNGNTDYLVAGSFGAFASASSKVKKANYIGVRIISEKEFLDLIESNKTEKKRLPYIKKVEIRVPVAFPDLDLD